MNQAGNHGLVAWAYRLNDNGALTIDWDLSRRQVAELAEAYRVPLGKPHGLAGRAEASRYLDGFANERCRSIPPVTR